MNQSTGVILVLRDNTYFYSCENEISIRFRTEIVRNKRSFVIPYDLFWRHNMTVSKFNQLGFRWEKNPPNSYMKLEG